MLNGFVPFPESFVEKYKEKGYWADKIVGEKGCAFILTKKNQQLAFEELIEFLKEERHIATFKLPERLELIEAFPMTKVGKIDKKCLRSIIREKLQIEKKT